MGLLPLAALWPDTVAVYVVLVAAVIGFALWWPVSLRMSASVDAARRFGALSVTTWCGKIDVYTVSSDGGEVDVVLQLRLLHLLPWRITLFRPQRPPYPRTTTGAEGEGDDSDGVRLEEDRITDLLASFGDRWRAVVRTLKRGVAALMPGVEVLNFRLSGWIGVGDAARTALFLGTLWAVLGSGAAWLQKHARLQRVPVVQLWPAYNRWTLRLELSGTVRLRLGRLLWAAGIAWLQSRRQPAVFGRAVPSENV